MHNLLEMSNQINIVREGGNIRICFNAPGVNLDTYNTIETVVKEAIESGRQLTLDLSQTHYANGDFFNHLIGEYMRTDSNDRIAALRRMYQSLTLIVQKGSRVHIASTHGRPGLFKYEFRRPAA